MSSRIILNQSSHSIFLVIITTVCSLRYGKTSLCVVVNEIELINQNIEQIIPIKCCQVGQAFSRKTGRKCA